VAFGSSRGTGVLPLALALAAVLATMAAICGVAGAAGGNRGSGSGGVGTTPGGGTTTSDEGVFPVRAKHTYGDGFGAGRGHEGQDLLANCGKTVVAAQAGRVQMNKYHSAAGNYVVIDGAGQLEDTVYMHLQSRSPLRNGEKVLAGDPIGLVGDTGRASTCHQHFEMWSNPGYYEGGSAIDPEPSLRLWDQKR
jgi:murein DD-endopeptidase MepM/ murein hydrolase activator NlpD